MRDVRPNGFWQIVCIAMSTSIQIASFSFPSFSIIYAKVFSLTISKFKKLFGSCKTNGIHNSSVMCCWCRRRCHSILCMCVWRKWILLFGEKRDVEQLPERWLSVRLQLVSVRCNFLSVRMDGMNCQAKQDKWLWHWRHKNTQRQRKQPHKRTKQTHWTKLFSVWQISWHEFAAWTQKCAFGWLGFARNALAKWLLLFIIAAVLCAHNTTNRLWRTHSSNEMVSARWQWRLPCHDHRLLTIRNEFRGNYYRVLERRRRWSAKKEGARGREGEIKRAKRRPVDRNVAKSVLLYIEFGFTHENRNTFQHFHPIEPFPRRNLFVCGEFMGHIWGEDVYMCSH